MDCFLLGTSKVCITPEYKVPLAGYAFREGQFDDVLHDIYLRVYYFRQSEQDKVIIQSDLIWFGSDFVMNMRPKLKEDFNLNTEDILFHGTHNHSGPQTSYFFTDSLGIPDDNYIEFLKEKVSEAIEIAKGNLECVTLHFGIGKSYLGINRRRRINGKILMMPNRAGIIDDDTKVIIFKKKTDEGIKGVLVNYACHANVSGENCLSSDYTGVAMEKIERYYGEGCTAIFLQGFTGNIRPALMIGEEFFTGTNNEVMKMAEQLYTNVIEIIDRDGLELMEPELLGKVESVQVEFQYVPKEEELQSQVNEDGIVGEWSRYMVAHKENCVPFKALEIFRLDFSNKYKILGMNGEIVIDYGLFIKEKYGQQILNIGYSNGMIGYVPTAEQIEEGGYESMDSTLYFALPSRFNVNIEEKIKEAIINIMNK